MAICINDNAVKQIKIKKRRNKSCENNIKIALCIKEDGMYNETYVKNTKKEGHNVRYILL